MAVCVVALLLVYILYSLNAAKASASNPPPSTHGFPQRHTHGTESWSDDGRYTWPPVSPTFSQEMARASFISHPPSTRRQTLGHIPSSAVSSSGSHPALHALSCSVSQPRISAKCGVCSPSYTERLPLCAHVITCLNSSPENDGNQLTIPSRRVSGRSHASCTPVSSPSHSCTATSPCKHKNLFSRMSPPQSMRGTADFPQSAPPRLEPWTTKEVEPEPHVSPNLLQTPDVPAVPSLMHVSVEQLSTDVDLTFGSVLSATASNFEVDACSQVRLQPLKTSYPSSPAHKLGSTSRRDLMTVW